uniref:Uncharacterized protein n=1 Tax=uncultured beta proteobacterium CBNPD1 BAC clone 578 TaxID=417305 RepID=B1N6K1_9PROT|nr:conserved hypothetical protein [uncultured beta proteobacterium CBNPD1 BAC clone 578]
MLKSSSPGIAWFLANMNTHRALMFASVVTLRWWRMTGSNRRPPACKAGALPAELIPQSRIKAVVGLVGFEPTTPALSRRCSNRLSYRPTSVLARSRQSTRLSLLCLCSR